MYQKSNTFEVSKQLEIEIMTYNEALKGFDELDLKEDFVKEFESYFPKNLLDVLKKSDSIKGTANLVRGLLRKYEIDSPEWSFWRDVFFYFITPEKMRIKPVKK